MTEQVKPALLTAEDIFAAVDLATIDVQVPEWPKDGKPGVVRLRMLSGDEAVAFSDGDKKTMTIRLLQMSIINEKGENLFTVEDIKRMQKKSFRAFVRLQKAALELNGLGQDAKND